MWPVADLTPFAAFAWEERGGYGDAYQTAQAFSAAARRARGEPAPGHHRHRDRHRGRRAPSASASPTGQHHHGRPRRRRGRARGRCRCSPPYGIDLPITVHREQIVLVDPGRDLGPVPVFSDLVSLQYIRPEGSGQLLFGNSDLAGARAGRPGPLHRTRPAEAFVDTAVGEGRHPPARAAPRRRSPRPTPAATTSPRTSIRSSPGTPLDGPRRRCRLLRARIQDLPAVGRLDRRPGHRREELATPTSRSRTSGWSRFVEGDLLRQPAPLRRRRSDALIRAHRCRTGSLARCGVALAGRVGDDAGARAIERTWLHQAAASVDSPGGGTEMRG